MCISMMDFRLRLSGDEVRWIKLPCGGCWQCRKVKVNDLVGRSLCEQAVSDWSVCVNLTYAPGPERERDGAHRLLLKKHVQDALKRLRLRFSVRYLIVGEYGAKRGRAHYHCIFFGRGPKPKWSQGMCHDEQFWPHGHIEVDWAVTEKAMRYAIKYMLKGRSDEIWKTQSKFPPLGNDWFVAKAKRDAEAGLIPPDFSYFPPGQWRRNENNVFFMTNTTRLNYLEAWCEAAGVPPLDECERRSDAIVSSLEALDRRIAARDAIAEDALFLIERREAVLRAAQAEAAASGGPKVSWGTFDVKMQKRYASASGKGKRHGEEQEREPGQEG